MATKKISITYDGLPCYCQSRSPLESADEVSLQLQRWHVKRAVLTPDILMPMEDLLDRQSRDDFFLGSLLWWPELCKANTTSVWQACNSLYILYKIIYACKHYINLGRSTKMHRKSLMYRTWKICIFVRKTRQGLSDPPIKSWHHQLSTGVLIGLYLIVVCLLEFLHNCPQLPSKMGQTGFLLVLSPAAGFPPIRKQSNSTLELGLIRQRQTST